MVTFKKVVCPLQVFRGKDSLVDIRRLKKDPLLLLLTNFGNLSGVSPGAFIDDLMYPIQALVLIRMLPSPSLPYQ